MIRSTETPAQARLRIDSEIRDHEIRYEMSSDEMLVRFHRGEMPDTAETARWRILVKALTDSCPAPATREAPFCFIEVEPIGTRVGHTSHGLLPCLVYPESQHGKDLRRLRLDLDLNLRPASAAMGVRAVDLSGLECGTLTLERESEWNRFRQLLRMGKARLEDERRKAPIR